MIVIVVVASVFIAALVLVETAVSITAINITSGDNACDQNGHSFPGLNTLPAWGSAVDTLTIHNSGYVQGCTISSVSSTTPGFSISGANTPLTIPYDGTESLSFTISAPFSYSGALTIDLE